MPGPAPKPDHQRQRRNAPTIEWTDLPADARVDEIPKMPSKLRARGKQMWETLWSTPMATLWSDSELASVERLCRLADAFHADPRPGTSGEMRQLEHGLGLTPKSRKELRWRIVDGDRLLEQNGEPLVPAAELRKKLRVVG